MPTTSPTIADRTKELIAKMLKERVPHSLTDSGDYYGRAYQANRKIENFDVTPEITVDHWKDDFSVTISVYHFLKAYLTLDERCDEFNAIPVEDWKGEGMYGLSIAGEEWLKAHGARICKPYNTYNGESDLSQTLQFAEVLFGDEDEDDAKYVLLQIHGGCDVRSGYTDAKLFKYKPTYGDHTHRDDFCYQNANVSVEVKNGRKKAVTYDKNGPGSDWYDAESGQSAEMTITEKSKITAYVDFNS